MTTRDYNKEYQDNSERKYSYDFDTILRKYMLEAVKPFISNYNNPALEMGCFKGDFTELLEKDFNNLTVIEASNELVEFTKQRVDKRVKFITSTFEEYNGNSQYDYIFLMHTLEHLDEPVEVLKKTKQWLTDSGKLFLICPNANAPSRQIAVKMGLIPYNAAVTPGEKEHGHRNTYSLDTLEREAFRAGLNTIHRTGIFFKALANYQWDKLLQTDIISKEYLDGCFKLGHQYPDLCASIMLVCTK
jgi:2-polyprenyl-3-methyl-5-hydroxy-6-metoxy-1,4-benzoquinol methylase